jgi:hypothetical protein
MVLHGLSLAVEGIVLGAVEGRLFGGAGKAALGGASDGRGAQQGSSALGATEQKSLRDHFFGCCGFN